MFLNVEIAGDEVNHGRIETQLPGIIQVKYEDEGLDICEEEQTRYLDKEKMAFVQSYLERAEDAHSVKTETSDSAMGTLSAPSEFQTEEASGKAVFSLDFVSTSCGLTIIF